MEEFSLDEQDHAADTEPNVPLSPDPASLSATGASDEITVDTVQEPKEANHAASMEDTMPASLPESSTGTPSLLAAPVTPMVPLPYPPAPAPSSAPLISPTPPMSAYAPPNFSQPLGPYAGQPPQGYVPPAPGSVPLLPPTPNYYGGYPQPGVPMVVTVRPENPSRTAAIIAEVILDLFGIFGVGWLIAGETTVGIILLVASFVWWPIAVLGTIFTAGLGVLCIVPLNIIFLLVSVIMLAQRTAARAY